MLKKLLNAWEDFFYPPTCASCQNKVEQSYMLCEDCRGKATFVRSYNAAAVGLEHLDAVLVMAHYRGGFQDVLHKVKFLGQEKLLAVLASEFALLWHQSGQKILTEFLEKLDIDEEAICLIPVPTDTERLQQRGYDLPESIFAPWCAEEGYPFTSCLTRVRATLPQYELDGQARRTNMLGAMKASSLPKQRILLIVDDIMTTGATLCECARALRAAGGADKIIIGVALCSDMQI